MTNTSNFDKRPLPFDEAIKAFEKANARKIETETFTLNTKNELTSCVPA